MFFVEEEPMHFDIHLTNQQNHVKLVKVQPKKNQGIVIYLDGNIKEENEIKKLNNGAEALLEAISHCDTILLFEAMEIKHYTYEEVQESAREIRTLPAQIIKDFQQGK